MAVSLQVMMTRELRSYYVACYVSQINKRPASLRAFVLYGAGTRRTVAFGEARFSAGLEVGGKFGVPQLVTINKSASYGFQWNRIGDLHRITT